jgi:hypothetical protein
MSDIIRIEPGTEAWSYLVAAVRVGRALSIQPRRDSTVALKVGEQSWSPTLMQGNIPAPQMREAPPNS